MSALGEDLDILANPGLASLQGLEQLSDVQGDVTIGEEACYHAPYGCSYWSGNETLPSLEGLDGLRHVGGRLGIFANPEMGSLAGLESLRVVGGDLAIIENDAVADLSALTDLAVVGGDVRVLRNPALPSGSAEALVQAIDFVGGDVEVD